MLHKFIWEEEDAIRHIHSVPDMANIAQNRALIAPPRGPDDVLALAAPTWRRNHLTCQ